MADSPRHRPTLEGVTQDRRGRTQRCRLRRRSGASLGALREGAGRGRAGRPRSDMAAERHREREIHALPCGTADAVARGSPIRSRKAARKRRRQRCRGRRGRASSRPPRRRRQRRHPMRCGCAVRPLAPPAADRRRLAALDGVGSCSSRRLAAAEGRAEDEARFCRPHRGVVPRRAARAASFFAPPVFGFRATRWPRIVAGASAAGQEAVRAAGVARSFRRR